MCIEYACCGGGIAISEKLVPTLVEYFIIIAVVFVLNMPLGTLPVTEGLVQLDMLLDEAGLANIGESFTYDHRNIFQYLAGGLGNRGKTSFEVDRHSPLIRLLGIITTISFARSETVMHFMYIL